MWCFSVLLLSIVISDIAQGGICKHNELAFQEQHLQFRLSMIVVGDLCTTVIPFFCVFFHQGALLSE